MKKKIITELSKKNIKTYLFFLVFTAFLWFALQFSKNYSKEIIFNIEYTKVDASRFIKSNSDKEINLTLEGNGFQLLKFYIFNRTLKLDVRKATTKTQEKNYFTGTKMLGIIKESLGYTGEITFSSKDTITVYFSEIITKKIPIKLKESVEYENGFTSSEGTILSKKMIEVKGPKVILDTLSFLKTKELKLDKLQKNVEGSIDLDLNLFTEEVTVNEKKIDFSIEVDKITEGEFKIPIEVINVKEKQRIQLFPKEVSVIFGVALKNYPKLKAEDFSVAVDMSKSSPKSNTLALKLIKAPSLAYNVRMSEKEVQFIVIK